MKKRFLYFLFLFTGILSISTAQGQILKGVIKDHLSGETLPGANIKIKGTTTGTVTDLNGYYQVSLNPGKFIVEYSFVGYTTEEVEITIAQGETVTKNIDLYYDITTFDEFVVIGYGSQKKKVVTGAIASVKSEEIKSIPILRAEQALQGRAAGVQVTNRSGQPGEAPTIIVRGTGTTGDSRPLYVVDGFVVGSIEFLNSSDIESIDVLKDAASCAIYGARGANGVVLITTNPGSKGKMRVTYSGYQGIQNVAKTIKLLNADEYVMMMNEGARNAGQTEPFDANEIQKYNTDWQSLLFQKNAPILSHDIAFEGGDEKTTFNSSVNYFSQQGIIGGEKSMFDRITARLNTRHKMNNALNVGANINYSQINSRGIESNQSFNGAYSSALNLDPLTPVYMEDQAILNTYPYSTEPVVTTADGQVYGISENIGAEIINPLALLELQNGKSKTDWLLGNFFADLEIIKGLKLNTNAGIEFSYLTIDSYRPLFYLNDAQLNTEKTSVSKTIERDFKWQWENTLSYSRKIGDHNFSALIGTSASKYNFENLYGFNAGAIIIDPEQGYLNMATDTAWKATGGAYEETWLSGFARITYDYQNRYSLTAIFRRDGSSKFGANNRFGNFPSIGVSWIISEEKFFPVINNLDLVKIRATYGINGNDRIGNYSFLSTIDKSRGYIFGGGYVFGASPAYIENEGIHWEATGQWDIAIDLGLFNNRLIATFDFYTKNTEGLLERIPIPAHVGNDPPYSNVGSVSNKGLEMSLNWRNNGKTLNYAVGLNAAFNVNKMTKIGNTTGIIDGADWAVAGTVTRSEVGYPIAYFYGYKTDGIFQNLAEVYQHIGSTGEVLQPNAQPGDVRFVDVNDDGELNEKDLTMIGSPTPDWNFGFTANFDYKNFDLGFLITGTYGNEIFNGMFRNDLRMTNLPASILDRWTGEGTSNSTPRFTWTDTNNNNRISDLYIEDGSYARLKNIQIGYNLPKNFLESIHVSKWRIYISAENLYTLTNYTGADPEIGALNSFDIAIDRGIYPQARTFRLGTTVTF